MKFFILLIVVLASAFPVYCRTLDRCSLAREMLTLGTPKEDLATWTCIAQYESSYQTNVVSPPTTIGSRNYGIFQINSLQWCQSQSGQFSHNGCNMSCSALLDDNIRSSVYCARQIKENQGWISWTVFRRRCRGKLPTIDSCFKMHLCKTTL